MVTKKAATPTPAQFWANAWIRAIATIIIAGMVMALAFLVPVWQGGTLGTTATYITALSAFLTGAGSMLLSILSRFKGDPNSGSFTS